jgi:hypothetical protein
MLHGADRIGIEGAVSRTDRRLPETATFVRHLTLSRVIELERARVSL